MLISTKGRYALTVMIDLAKHGECGYIPLRDIAERQELSQKYLEAIFKPLSDQGYVLGMRGKNGGYKLARHPEDISILEVLEITEGGVEPVSPHIDDKDNLMWLWDGLHETIKDYLSSKNLAMLANQEEVSSDKERIFAIFN